LVAGRFCCAAFGGSGPARQLARRSSINSIRISSCRGAEGVRLFVSSKSAARYSPEAALHVWLRFHIYIVAVA
jgi:hypothetical protein